MQKRYQVFISSTYTDLKDVRETVQKELYLNKYMPIGMECFKASDERPWEIIKDNIEGIDIFVLIIAGRYGSKDKDGVSFTEREYNYARERRIPVLAFIRNSRFISVEDADTGEDYEKLKAFKVHLKTEHTVSEWNEKEDLSKKILEAIAELKEHSLRKGNPLTSWIHCTCDEDITLSETTMEYYILNVHVSGTVSQCEKGESEIIYIGSALVDSPDKPVVYKDRIQSHGGDIFAHNFTPREILIGDDNAKNPSILDYKITSSSENDKLFFAGEVLVRQKLEKVSGSIGINISYKAKYVCIFLDISKTPFIRDYGAKVFVGHTNKEGVVEKDYDSVDITYNQLSMTYTITARNVNKNSYVAFEWENQK